MRKTSAQKFCLLGIASFISYAAAVIFSPLAYPGYDWMKQAVSDLSAANAPSLELWNRLSSVYNVCEVLCAAAVCIAVEGFKTKMLRIGIYIFAAMEFISAIGFRMFPLSDSGFAGGFQDKMHLAVTAAVVVLSIASLVIIIIAGFSNKTCLTLGICASAALLMMLTGALGMNIVPTDCFGIVERFSVFAATGFNAAMGLYIFLCNIKEKE